MADKQGKPGRKAVSIAELRDTYRELDERERLSFVAHHFCGGKTPSQIHKLLVEEFGGEVRREEPYRLLQVGAVEGYFRYDAPLEVTLGESLTKLPGVQQARVVCTRVLKDVTVRAAEVLLDLIRQEWIDKQESHRKTGMPDQREADTVRIGLAGGHTVREIVRALVELLERQDPAKVPRYLGFHTVCTGIHYDDASTDPNAFVTHLLRVPGLEAKTFSVPYQAPAVTDRALRNQLRANLPHIRKAEDAFELVEILVTSGSSWRVTEITPRGELEPAKELRPSVFEPDEEEDPQLLIHSQLMKFMTERDPVGYEALKAAGAVADTLWQPLSFSGPIDVDTRAQAMTLAKLEDVPGLITGGKKVLLALGPYYHDVFHKGDVLLAALGGPERVAGPLFTHLVCDHRTAGAAARAAGLTAEDEARGIA